MFNAIDANNPILRGSCSVAVIHVAADAGPGSFVVFLAIRMAGLGDIEEGGELAANPGVSVILIGDRRDAQMSDEAFHLASRVHGTQIDESLGQSVDAAPETDPERARIVALDGLRQRLRTCRCLVRSGSRHAVGWLPCEDALIEFFGSGPAFRVQKQVGSHLPVSLDDGVHRLGMCLGPLPG